MINHLSLDAIPKPIVGCQITINVTSLQLETWLKLPSIHSSCHLIAVVLRN